MGRHPPLRNGDAVIACMKESNLTLNFVNGMHARPASVFVREAARFRSEVFLTSDGVTVNGKSIMGLLMLALGPGSQVTLRTEGPDEENALEALAQLLSRHEE